MQFIDTLKKSLATNSIPVKVDSIIFRHHPYTRFTNPVRLIISERKWEGKEAIFYTVLGILLFFAFIRTIFDKYILDVFRLFFRTTLRQRQIKEQLMQTPMPSLLLNILFVLSAAMFATLVLLYFELGVKIGFLYLFLYCLAGIGGIYLIKFITLKLSGWLFRLSESTDTYIFIVFSANKIIGVVLLPFLILLGFSAGTVYQTALTLSLVLIGALFMYRFYLSYVSIHKQVHINFFHFVLYLAAFEVIPLLLINKLLFMFLR